MTAIAGIVAFRGISLSLENPIIRRCLAVTFFYIICLLLSAYCSSVAAAHLNTQAPMPDAGHLLFSHFYFGHFFDGLLALLVVVTFWRTLNHELGLRIIRRVLTIHGLLLLLRCVTMSVTAYPNPNPLCTKAHKLSFWNFAVYFPWGACGDLMFSGTATICTLLFLVWTHYTRNIFLRMLIGVGFFAELYGLLAHRKNYTVDVVVAVFTSVAVWHLYHVFALGLPSTLRKRSPLMFWLEGGRHSEKYGEHRMRAFEED